MRGMMSAVLPAENGTTAWICFDGQVSAKARRETTGIASVAAVACRIARRVIMMSSPIDGPAGCALFRGLGAFQSVDGQM